MNKNLAVLTLYLCALSPLSVFSATRPIAQTWDIGNGNRRLMEIGFFQAESVDLNLASIDGTNTFKLTNDNLFVVWEITGWNDYTNVYAVTTGTVVSASNGIARFNLSPSQANLPAGTYRGFLRALQVSGTNLQQVAVLAWQRIKVDYSPDSRFYNLVGPITSPAYYPASVITNLIGRVEALEQQPSVDTNLTAIVTKATNEIAAITGWGDHAGLYLTLGAWATQSNLIYQAIANATPGGYAAVSNAALTASGWGNHALAGYLTAESDPAWHAGTNALWSAIWSNLTAEAFAAYTNSQHSVNTNLQSEMLNVSNRVTSLEAGAITNLNQLLMQSQLAFAEDFSGDWYASGSNVWTNAAGWTAQGDGIDVGTPGQVFMDTTGDCLISPFTTNGYAYTALDYFTYWGAGLEVRKSTNGTDWTANISASENVRIKLCFTPGMPPMGSDPYIELYSSTVYGFIHPESLGETNSTIGRIVLVDEATVAQQPVTLSQFNAGIVASNPQRWSEFPALKDVELRGNRLMWDDNYYTQGVATNESGEPVLSIGWNRNPIIQVIGGETEFVNPYITQFSAGETTTLRVLGSTGWKPYPEYTTNILSSPIVWTRMATNEFESTYPTLEDGQYTLTWPTPGGQRYYRTIASNDLGAAAGGTNLVVMRYDLQVDGLIINEEFQAAQSSIASLTGRVAAVEGYTNTAAEAYSTATNNAALISALPANPVTSIVVNGTTNSGSVVDLGQLSAVVTNMAVQGAVNGTNRTAILFFDFTNNVWSTAVTDD